MEVSYSDYQLLVTPSDGRGQDPMGTLSKTSGAGHSHFSTGSRAMNLATGSCEAIYGLVGPFEYIMMLRVVVFLLVYKSYRKKIERTLETLSVGFRLFYLLVG